MRILTIIIAILIVAYSLAFADTIYFKDGGRVEGVVKEETEDSIVIDIGFGTMSARKDEIDHIEKATPQELERLKKKRFGYEIDKGKWALDGYEDIRTIYLKALDDKNTLQAARIENERIKAEISKSEKKMSELLGMLDKKGEELNRVDSKKDVEKYNEIVTATNSINADFNKMNNKIKALYDEQKQSNGNLAKLADRYRSNYQLFKDTLSKRQSGKSEDKLTTDEIYFFKEMANKVEDMERDFKKDIAKYTSEGGHIVVDALIDNSVSVQLIVDTGASIVLISTDVASRLGVEYKEIPTTIEIIMADNSSAEAKPITLTSVKVGEAEVKNVQAAILAKEAIGGVDGLLGMSFLNHFVIKVDSSSNNLILEQVL